LHSKNENDALVENLRE